MGKYNLITPSSPHFHDKSSTTRVMLDVIIALLPATIAAVVIFGLKALCLISVCVLTAVLSETIFNLIVKKKNTVGDLSCIVTGLLLALNLGTEVKVWQAAVGTLFSIVVVKMLFGGIGKNFANPAIAGRVFLLDSYSTVTSFSNPIGVELVTSATPLVILSQNELSSMPSMAQMLLGLHGGTIGETCIIALVIGWIYLSVRGVIKWYVPLSYILTVFVLYFFATFDPYYAFLEILSGGLFLGAIFMATDYVTTPITNKGKVAFCILCGILTFIIRRFCSLPEGVSFSILIMNIFTPYIEKLTHTVPLGGSTNAK